MSTRRSLSTSLLTSLIKPDRTLSASEYSLLSIKRDASLASTRCRRKVRFSGKSEDQMCLILCLIFFTKKILVAGRYDEDIVNAFLVVYIKFEKERGHVACSIDCYVKQYGVSEQEALDALNKQVVDPWKDINEEFLRPTAAPMAVLMRVLNLTKVVDLLYKGDDGYTRVGKVVKDKIASHFIDPVPII
ncbi:hypothetical protein L3X38_023545 [Prunus dulcis]|uniref:Terpene synthase metal-binding domain-containing protein n=1 Tax=Prunus dulcis TaxID=3755 RepID=A0AAD4Z5N4_PRUDU|nr:hypothetical protein L3X38_023545 [Prunus dulcis]